jgi:hypothetical protein
VLGTGAHAFLADWDKIIAAAGGISLLALGGYSAKGATGIGARYIEARLGEPHSFSLLIISIGIGMCQFCNNLAPICRCLCYLMALF